MDTERLRQKISESSMTCEEISEAIGINPSTYYRKMNAQGETFTIAQAKSLARVLRLSNVEASEIFLD